MKYGLLITYLKAKAFFTVVTYMFPTIEKNLTLSAWKIMATDFLDCNGISLMEFMPQSIIMNTESYCEEAVSGFRTDDMG